MINFITTSSKTKKGILTKRSGELPARKVPLKEEIPWVKFLPCQIKSVLLISVLPDSANRGSEQTGCSLICGNLEYSSHSGTHPGLIRFPVHIGILAD